MLFSTFIKSRHRPNAFRKDKYILMNCSKLVCHALVLLCMTPTLAGAQDVATQFVDSGRVMYDAHAPKEDYRLALSSLKKVNNQWRVSREQKLQGSVERKTIELGDGTNFGEAKRQLQQSLAQISGATVAFTCEGLDCGSSNGWANHVLGVKTLYGLDLYQYYTVLHIPRGGEIVHGVYYLVQRGSGRVYLQQDLIRSKSTATSTELVTAAALEQRLTTNGYWTIAGADDALQKMTETEVALVVDLLRKNRRWKIAVVGHNYQGVSLAEQVERSRTHAQVVEKQLLDAGVDAKRLSNHGIGGLAPAGRVGDGRVELVLQRP